MQSSKHLSYALEFAKGLSGKPSILLAEPRLVEVMGAGFTKSPGSKVRCLPTQVDQASHLACAALRTAVSTNHKSLSYQRAVVVRW